MCLECESFVDSLFVCAHFSPVEIDGKFDGGKWIFYGNWFREIWSEELFKAFSCELGKVDIEFSINAFVLKNIIGLWKEKNFTLTNSKLFLDFLTYQKLILEKAFRVKKLKKLKLFLKLLKQISFQTFRHPHSTQLLFQLFSIYISISHLNNSQTSLWIIMNSIVVYVTLKTIHPSFASSIH